MKVVCLKSIRRRRSPYERMPYYPRSRERYVDEPLWDTIRLPIVPYRPWVMLADDEGRQPPEARTQPAQDVSFAYHDVPQSISFSPPPDVQVEQQTSPTPASPIPSQTIQNVRESEMPCDAGTSVQAPSSLAPVGEDVMSGKQHPSAPPRLLTRSLESQGRDLGPSSTPSWKPPVILRMDAEDATRAVNLSKVPPSANTRASTAPTEGSVTHERAMSHSLVSAQHKLRKYDVTMHTFRSEGGILDEPPRVDEAAEFDVYLHRGDDGDRVWYATADSRWVPATFDMLHPRYPEYTLYLSNDKWARWLLKKTVTTYKGRKVHEAQSMPR